MTKEKLIQIVKTFDFYSTKNKEGLLSRFEEFFDANVVIEKGKNRHTYMQMNGIKHSKVLE